MEPALLIKYLKFLFETADALSRKERIEDFEIAALHRELRDFKSRAQSTLPSDRESAIQSLELKVTESDLGGSKLEPLKFLLAVLILRAAVRHALEERRQTKAKRHIEEFKSAVRDVLFIVEHGNA
jgi:hypothetical protein